jgi:dipeptidyl aminopeptidase/acylaminoacyl peptidase
MADITNQLQAVAGAAGGTQSYIVFQSYFPTSPVDTELLTLLDASVPGTVTLATTYVTGMTSTSVEANNSIFSPDGKYIAISGNDNSFFRLLNHTTPGTLSLSATYNFSLRTSSAFTPDGNYIALAGNSPLILLDHTTPGTLSYATSYVTTQRTFSCDFNFDGSYLVWSSTFRVTLLSHSAGSLTYSATYLYSSSAVYNAVAFEPVTGNYIAAVNSANTPRFILFDHTTPGSLTIGTTYAIGASPISVNWSPDGDYIAVALRGFIGAGSQPYINLLDHTTPGAISLAATYSLSDVATNARFSPDGKYIAVTWYSTPYFAILDHTTPGSLSLATTYTMNNYGSGLDWKEYIP